MIALRQSHAETMACEVSYTTQVIEGKRMPANLQSDRGTEIHWVMWQYIQHCVKRRVPSDWAALDRFALLKGVEARQILQSLRDTYTVDWQHSVGAELKLRLDQYFQPCDQGGDYEGTLDHLTIDGGLALVDDFKSHPAPFEPTTVQAHLYPLLVFQAYGNVEEVTFRLLFVRYKKCVREVTYTRSQVPELMEYMQSIRERQLDIHARYAIGKELKALPGAHCGFCPKLANVTCPIAEFNPHATQSPEQRLRFNVWANQLKQQNDAVLKSTVVATEKPITITDGNGETYQYDSWPTVQLQFPLRETYGELEAWRKQTGEDLAPALVVGATELKQKLKAFKRKDLADAIANHTDPKGGGKWGIKVGGKVEE